MKRIFLLVLLITLCLIAAGCRRSGTTADEQNIEMTMEVEPESPSVGDAELVITITDSEGSPVSGATLDIRGDMSHAGMAPVLAEGISGENGVYRVPFEWTMAGDWIVTVTATLPDGQLVEESFELAVSSD